MTPSITLLDEAVAHCDLHGFFKLPSRPASFTRPLVAGSVSEWGTPAPVAFHATDRSCPSPTRCTFTGCCGTCQPPAA